MPVWCLPETMRLCDALHSNCTFDTMMTWSLLLCRLYTCSGLTTGVEQREHVQDRRMGEVAQSPAHPPQQHVLDLLGRVGTLYPLPP